MAARDAAIDHVLTAGVPAWIIHPAATAGIIRDWYARQKGPPMRTKTVQASIKAGPEADLNDGEFIVYASTFTRTPDAYGDIVAPGAFTDTIKAWKDSGNVLPGLFGHRMDDPDFWVAYAIDMGQDEHGWWIKGAFDLDSPKGPQVYRLVKDKRITQLSFAYDVVDSAHIELDDGTRVNELRAVDIYEFSFVPIGANQDTSVVDIKAVSAKAGRVLAQKHIDSLRSAQDAIGGVIAAAEADLTTDQAKAPASTVSKPEEPSQAKGEGARPAASPKALAATAALAAITAL